MCVEAPAPDYNAVVPTSLYNPRQLILKMMDVKEDRPLQKALQTVLEQQVIRTKIKAVESPRGSLDNDKQETYLQEFVVAELHAKQIYNMLRRFRDTESYIKLLMFEPDVTHTKVVDAWMITLGRIQYIRTSSLPYRDTSTARVPVTAGQSVIEVEAPDVATFFTITGELNHQLELIDIAQAVFDEQNKTAKNTAHLTHQTQ